MGPSEYPSSEESLQPPGRQRIRRCLLKGCERRFLPTHPRRRYCSPQCQGAARDWQRWRAARRYRATPGGQERRREQSRRYRERRRERLPALDRGLAEASEGQLKEDFPEDCSGRPCRRPGCYQLFLPRPRSPLQSFCCHACYRALRRAWQRESRWRQRRRRIRASHFRPPPRC